jgi:hypothetical protein
MRLEWNGVYLSPQGEAEEPEGPSKDPSTEQTFDAVRKLASGLAFESILAHAQRLVAKDANVSLEDDPLLARVHDMGRDSAIEAVSAHVRRLMSSDEEFQRTVSEPV